MSRRRPGLPDVDALIEVADREQAKFDKVVVVNQAEDVVTTSVSRSWSPSSGPPSGGWRLRGGC